MKRHDEQHGKADPARPVTMSMVAQRAGLSRSAVSYALRNHPSIPENTCRRVQELAEKMGYRRNAYVSALMAQVQRRKVDTVQPVIAWLTDRSLPDHVIHGEFYRAIQKSASERAAQLGYQLEPFSCNQGDITMPRLGKVLRTRGIQGLIIGPVGDHFPQDTDNFPFQNFACSAIGYSLRSPILHRVGTDFSQGMKLVWDRVLTDGFQRPSLLISKSYDARTNYQIRAMFLALQSSIREIDRIPACLVNDGDAIPGFLSNWLKEHRPDVLICATQPDLVESLTDLSVKIACPPLYWFNHCMTLPIPGVRQPDRQLGRAAIDIVVGQLHRNEKGIPDVPNLTLIPYEWIDAMVMK